MIRKPEPRTALNPNARKDPIWHGLVIRSLVRPFWINSRKVIRMLDTQYLIGLLRSRLDVNAQERIAIERQLVELETPRSKRPYRKRSVHRLKTLIKVIHKRKVKRKKMKGKSHHRPWSAERMANYNRKHGRTAEPQGVGRLTLDESEVGSEK